MQNTSNRNMSDEFESADPALVTKPFTDNIQPTQLSYGITLLGGKVHESITKKATELADLPYGNLLDGVQWPDAPSRNDSETGKLGAVFKVGQPGTLTYESHHGKYQFWHSMVPDDGTGRVYTNGEVKELVVNQALEWFEQAQRTGNTFHLGKVLHMVQDSYSNSHVVRDENGNVKNFQSYNEQDGHAHGLVDKPQIKTVIESNGIERHVVDDWQNVPGAMQALEASTQILKLYKSGASSKELADYLHDHVYQFENEHTKDTPAGGTDPQYAPKPKTSIAENTSTPEIKADEPIKNGGAADDDGYLKGTLKEYLTLHHGTKSAESIMIGMQEILSASSLSANQNAGFDRG